MRILVTAFIVMSLLLAGCATTTPKPIPAGCENAWVYKVPDFLPAGPAVIRTAIATLGAVKPEYRPLVAVASVAAWQALAVGNLSNAIQALAKVLKKPEIVIYTQPALVLLDELAAQGMIDGKPVQLNECDKNVLMSLMKNIGLDAGADPGAFL